MVVAKRDLQEFRRYILHVSQNVQTPTIGTNGEITSIVGSAKEQKKSMTKIYNEWKGNHEQIDDVLLIGIKV